MLNGFDPRFTFTSLCPRPICSWSWILIIKRNRNERKVRIKPGWNRFNLIMKTKCVNNDDVQVLCNMWCQFTCYCNKLIKLWSTDKGFFFSSLVYVDHFSAVQGVSCFFRHFYNYCVDWRETSFVVYRLLYSVPKYASCEAKFDENITAEKAWQTNKPQKAGMSRNCDVTFALRASFDERSEWWENVRAKGYGTDPLVLASPLAFRLLVTFHVIPNWRACCQASLIWKTVHVSNATTQIRWHFPNMAWHCRSFFSALIIIFNQR